MDYLCLPIRFILVTKGMEGASERADGADFSIINSQPVKSDVGRDAEISSRRGNSDRHYSRAERLTGTALQLLIRQWILPEQNCPPRTRRIYSFSE